VGSTGLRLTYLKDSVFSAGVLSSKGRMKGSVFGTGVLSSKLITKALPNPSSSS